MTVQLRAPRHRVSGRTPWLWAALALAQVAAPVVAAVVAGWVWSWFTVPWWGWLLIGVAAVGYVATMPVIRYRTHRWETTDAAVYTQTGWIGRERRVAPMSRVQTVDLEQGALARVLGLASVTVTTASAAGPVRIDGLDLPVAERLVAELTGRADLQPGDAT